MNKPKNILVLTLMVSSIGLLLVLQIFFLHNSYERAFFGLRRDSYFIFRNTVFALRDSVSEKSIRAVSADTIAFRSLDPGTIQSINIHKGPPADTITASYSTVKVFVNNTSSSKDSIIDAIRPMTRHLKRSIEDGEKSFVIRLTPDTLNLDTLHMYTAEAFQKASLPVKFSVQYQMTPPEKHRTFKRPDGSEAVEFKPSLFADTLHLEPIRLNPMSGYAISIFPVLPFVVKQIAPQIIFSVFLTLLTLVAFIILYRNVRAQQRLMQLKNDFISNVTHELKTPVATVSVALEALKNFHALNDPRLTKEYLNIAQNELNRLTLMTDKMLKATVFESKGIRIEQETIDLRKITGQILESMRLIFEKRNAQVDFNTTGDAFIMTGENTHMTNVIYNLLDNALKYSPERPVITITLEETAKELILAVQDEGLGIADQYKRKIFEKFFRVPTGNVHTIKGYGLGLSYVSGVVKAHGGYIDVQSEFGKGSSFILHFPKTGA